MTQDSRPTAMLLPWGRDMLAFQHVGGRLHEAPNGVRLHISPQACKAYWAEAGLEAEGRTPEGALQELRDAALKRRAAIDRELYPSKMLTNHLELAGCPMCPWFRYGACTHPDAPHLEEYQAPWDVCPIRKRAVFITVAR